MTKTRSNDSLDGRTNLHWGDKNVRYFDYTIDAVVGDVAEGRKPSGSPIRERPSDPATPDGLRRAATNGETIS